MAQAPEDPTSLPRIITNIHKFSAMRTNKRDGVTGRKIWWNYWDSVITYERSYYARLNYIHFNPVRHGYADHPLNYRFSSYRNFHNADPERAETMFKEYPFDQVRVKDDFGSAV
jgi:putative transposase